MAGILAKRKKGAAALPVAQFEDLCGKLASKYGEAPVDAWAASQQQQQYSDSDDDYSEAFDDGIVAMQSPQQQHRMPEPEPEPVTLSLSRDEAAGQRTKLLAEIKKTETTIFSWESIVGSQSENREALQQSLDGLVKRLGELHAEVATLDATFPAQGVRCDVLESAVIEAPLPAVWSVVRTVDFAWISTVTCTQASKIDASSTVEASDMNTNMTWSDGSRWTVQLDHLSDHKCKLSLKVVEVGPSDRLYPQLGLVLTPSSKDWLVRPLFGLAWRAAGCGWQREGSACCFDDQASASVCSGKYLGGMDRASTTWRVSIRHSR